VRSLKGFVGGKRNSNHRVTKVKPLWHLLPPFSWISVQSMVECE
jgi:hypothetical protein